MEPASAVDACTAILRGERSPEPRFAALIAAFAEEYGIEVVNVTTDATSVRGSSGRLNLWCRTAADRDAFRDASSNYDRAKQARASELVPGGPWFAYATDHSRELLVAFIDAGVRACGGTARELLGDDRVVRVDGAFGRLVAFVGTKAEAAELRAAPVGSGSGTTGTGQTGTDGPRTGPARSAHPLVQAWETRLWAAFGEVRSPEFVPRDRFVLEVDSQEAYVDDYRGSGYSYWR